MLHKSMTIETRISLKGSARCSRIDSNSKEMESLGTLGQFCFDEKTIQGFIMIPNSSLQTPEFSVVIFKSTPAEFWG